ncbi:hypothetical protein BKA70DRAFT_1227338 [Coprinopsis sp. MPI-PUGE-AT-0042]|nr:hypothetical protein BKA70DRAFT_1227338 [Coprinopsis sp. MPI-PUGE-AT-0042]
MPLSKLETVLMVCTQNDGKFLDILFHHWPVKSILCLSMANMVIHAMIKRYMSQTWNVRGFLRHWFRNPAQVLKAMDTSQALFYGENVLRFFHRTRPDDGKPLELCIQLSHITYILGSLAFEKYEFQQPLPGYPSTFSRSLHLAVSCDGDISRSFTDVAAFTGMITPTAAICPFAESTMGTMRSFIISGDRTIEQACDGDSFSLKCGSSIVETFEIHRDAGYFPEIEVGPRFLGDKHCWVIPVDERNSAHFGASWIQYRGPCFEVVDHRSGLVKRGAYLRVGEPLLLSAGVLIKLHIRNRLLLLDFPYLGSSDSQLIN